MEKKFLLRWLTKAPNKYSPQYAYPGKWQISQPALFSERLHFELPANSIFIRIIEILLAWFKSKSSLVRLRTAIYFQIAFKRYSIEVLQKHYKQIELEFFLPGIDDPAQEVRK